MSDGYTVLYAPPPPHEHSYPRACPERKGWIVRCDACGEVAKCKDGDYWYWSPLTQRAVRRLEKERGIV